MLTRHRVVLSARPTDGRMPLTEPFRRRRLLRESSSSAGGHWAELEGRWNMSEEDRATPEYAQGAAGEQTGTAGHPAGGGLAERGGGPVVPPETAVMAPTPPGGRGRPGDPGGPPRPDPKRAKTVPRPLFYAILSLFLVALLAIAGLVVTRPKATAGVAVRSPSAGVSSPSADNSASAST